MSLQLKQNLTERQLAILNSEMEKHKKSVGAAYVLFLFFGFLGVHKFYMGKVFLGIIYPILSIVGWAATLSGYGAYVAELAGDPAPQGGAGAGIMGILCLAALGILMLIDLFTIPGQIRQHYEKTEERIIKKLIEQ